MEAEERARREAEIDELCQEIDDEISSFFNTLDKERDKDLIRDIEEAKRILLKDRSKAGAQYLIALNALGSRRNIFSDRFIMWFEETALDTYRTSIKLHHSQILLELEDWKRRRSPPPTEQK